MMTPKKCLLIAVFAMLAMGFIGIAASEVSDADDEPVVPAVTEYKVTYTVGDRTYTVPSATATVTLKTIADIGAVAPAGVGFDVWFDGTNKYAAGSTLIISSNDGEAKLVAYWKATEYTATFISYDGKVLGVPVKGVTKTVTTNDDGTQTIADATPVDLSAVAAGLNIARQGYIFNGWLTEGAEKAVATDDLGKLTADITYSATYVVDYKVTFIDGDKTYITNVANLVIPDLGTRTGFTFVGWFVDGVEADPTDYEYKADTTFVAKWQNVNCYVTFVAGEESFVVPVLYGEKVVEPKLPAGYAKWDFDFSKAITGDVTIKAIAEAPAAPEKPTGLNDPLTLSAVMIGVLVLLALIALFVYKVKKGDWVVGRAKKEKTE
ncbi:MAG: hypothetical protein E7Z65_06495 [Thermoplasmata archaeon]|nr:hypothetical protein [Thermoplasmata archaeon]